MKILNPKNLPEAIVKAVTPTDPPSPDRIGVTQLVNPPLIRTLLLKHWGELEERVEKRTWLLLGQALHLLLEKNAPEEAHVEEKIILPVEYTSGVTVDIAGVFDLHHGRVLTDYKCTSAWSFMLGEKPEWEAQLNVYAYMLDVVEAIKTEKLQILAILRDWTWDKAERNRDYPESELILVDVPLWDKEKALQYIMDRVQDHINNPERPCLPSERWRRESTWAVKKEGRKTALRVLKDHREAVHWAFNNGHAKLDNIKIDCFILNPGITIEERVGMDVRCLRFCPVRSVCKESIYYGKEEAHVETIPPEEP